MSQTSNAALLMGEERAAGKTALLDIKPRRGFTALEVTIATGLLMTGPRASRPTWRAVRKTIARVRSGGSLKGGWRSWPREGARA